MVWGPLELGWRATFMDTSPAFGTWSTNKEQSAGTGKEVPGLQQLYQGVSCQTPPAFYALTSKGAAQISQRQYTCK